MPNYRRAIVPGGTFFFTVVSWQRRPVLCHPDIRATLRAAITTVREAYPFTINAWVLLPDHLHCVWTLPDGDTDFAVRWAMIKRFVTRRAGGSGDGARSAPYISDLLLSENIGKGAIQDHGSQTETIGGHFQPLHSNYWIFRRDCG